MGPGGKVQRVDQHLPGGRGIGGAVVDRAIIVLDLLDRDDVRRVQIVGDGVGDGGEAGGAVARIEIVDVERGQVVFRVGETGDRFYIVETGAVVVDLGRSCVS